MNTFAALVLSLPTRNSTSRMRVWRALKESGCAVLRDGVYLLPSAAAAALEKVEAEIRSQGGFAMTLALTARSDPQQDQLRKLFDRSAGYGALVDKMHSAKAALARLGPRRGLTAVRRLEGALERLGRLDFFPGEAKTQAAGALSELMRGYKEMYAGSEPRSSKRDLRRFPAARYQRRTWATRSSPWVDRLASAWLIKRFIDREAKFLWLARPSDCPKKAIGFDFDGAQFTHIKKRVTFEVLMASFGLDHDAALAAIGRSVHFLDVGGVPVPDAQGLATVLKGAKERAKNDDALLAGAMRTFDLFYSAYQSGAETAS